MIRLAHRGHWHKKGVENTISAFNASLRDTNCNGIETDLRQMNLNDPKSWVVFHDETMTRLSGTDGPITPSIPIKQNNNSDFMPTLNTFCNWFNEIKRPFVINVEIKAGTTHGVQYLVTKINANATENTSIIYSSFKPNVVNTILTSTSANIGILLDNTNELSQFQLTNKKSVAFIAQSYQRHLTHPLTTSFTQGVYFSTMDDYVDYLKKPLPNIGLLFFEGDHDGK